MHLIVLNLVFILDFVATNFQVLLVSVDIVGSPLTGHLMQTTDTGIKSQTFKHFRQDEKIIRRECFLSSSYSSCVCFCLAVSIIE